MYSMKSRLEMKDLVIGNYVRNCFIKGFRGLDVIMVICEQKSQ